MQIKKKLKEWPRIIFLVFAILPVIFLILIMLNLVLNSRTAIHTVGFSGLFSTRISGVFSTAQGLFGIIPAIWGTFLVILVSMGIAIPVSLAMAIFSSEFNLRFLGKGMRPILGILSGIPSIVYALMSVVFAQLFIIPKFTGAGLSPGKIPIPAQRLPFNTSTLLGGIMLSMLIIPFLAPLFDDALRDVPHSLKEASLALGSGRWYTLKKISFPHALSGLISASSLGILKAMGDVVIVGLVIGFESPLPNPLFDILKSTAPLTSTGAGFSGGFGQSLRSPLRDSAANFTGLLLLVLAFIILVLVAVLQRRFKKRYPG